MMTETMFFEIESRWIYDNQDLRLNASSYHPESANALLLVDKLNRRGVSIETIGNIVKEIFYPPRFKRIYAKKGTTFLSSKDIFDFLPVGKKIKNVSPKYFIKPSWILVTRSGSVGRVLIANKLLSQAAISEHVIRIVPTPQTPVPYLYAYLNSRIGQPLMIKDIFGGVVDEIEPNHIANIPIPRIPDLEEEINQKILQAHKLREEAQELLLKAEEMIYSELGLPKIDEDDVEYFGGELGRLVKAFEVKASELDYRLDASYHVPILRLIKNKLKEQEKKGRFQLKKLGEGIAKVFDLPTYKRIYVKPEEGYPILSGVHLKQIKLYDLKYISGVSFYQRGKSIIDKYKIKKGWILTTERGTTGVSALVTKYWDGWLASHNILRVVPLNINSGYLLAYLNTEYAQYQLKSKELGAVVEVLDPRDMENILIPIPMDKSIEDKIGSLVIEAYNKKDRANQIEEEAIKELEQTLMKIAEGQK